jgi:hypothetical protein
MSQLRYRDVPIVLSQDVPACTECGRNMFVMRSGPSVRTQFARCICGHEQPFPWPLKEEQPDKHAWVKNL